MFGIDENNANANRLAAGCPGGDLGNHPNGTPNAITGSIAVQLIPYDDTPNPGGEYKVWLIAADAGGCTLDNGDIMSCNLRKRRHGDHF